MSAAGLKPGSSNAIFFTKKGMCLILGYQPATSDRRIGTLGKNTTRRTSNVSVPWPVFPYTMRPPKKKAAKPRIEPITCPDCGGQSDLMRRTPHPNIKGEIWTFECRKCGKQSEKSKLD
jgi:hypothetical protein